MCIYKYCDWLGWPVDPSWASNLIGGSVFWRLRQLMTVEAKSHGFPWIQFLLACRGHFCHPFHHPCYLWANAFVKIGQMVGDEPTQVLQHLGSHLHKSFVIWHPQRSWGLTLIQTGFLLIAITDQIKVVLNAASIACILVSWFFASVCVFMKSTL